MNKPSNGQNNGVPISCHEKGIENYQTVLAPFGVCVSSKIIMTERTTGRKKRSRINSIILIAVIIIALGAVIFYILQSRKPIVELGQVTSGPITTAVYATGIVSAERQATLRAQVSGKLNSLSALQGQFVRSGSVLGTISVNGTSEQITQAEAAIETTKITYETALDQFHKAERLSAQDAIAKNTLDLAKSDLDRSKSILDQSKAALAQLRSTLEQRNIIAPMSGIVIRTQAKAGDVVVVGQQLVTIVDTASLEVDAEVDETDVTKIMLGQKAILAFDAYGAQRFEGKISRIVPITDQIKKTSHIIISIINTPALQDGMTATANIIIGERAKTTLVPKEAVIRQGDSTFVWIVSNKLLKKAFFKGGESDARWVESLSNLNEGTTVVTNPTLEFKEGIEVKTAVLSAH